MATRTKPSFTAQIFTVQIWLSRQWRDIAKASEREDAVAFAIARANRAGAIERPVRVIGSTDDVVFETGLDSRRS